jgi:hypothetical protein
MEHCAFRIQVNAFLLNLSADDLQIVDSVLKHAGFPMD